jgi:hypothetical protein
MKKGVIEKLPLFFERQNNQCPFCIFIIENLKSDFEITRIKYDKAIYYRSKNKIK